MNMNLHQPNSYKNDLYKCLSDNEDPRNLFNNSEIKTTTPRHVQLISCHSEDDIHCENLNSNEISLLPPSFCNSDPQSRQDVNSTSPLDTIPKAFIDRSTRSVILDVNEKKKYLAQLIANMESENSENSIPVASISSDTIPPLNCTWPVLGEPILPALVAPPTPVELSSISNNTITDYFSSNIAPPKRSQTLDPYASEDSNFSVYDDYSGSYGHFPHHPNFLYPNHPTSFCDFKPQGFRQSYDTTNAYTYPSAPSFSTPQSPSFNRKYVFGNVAPNYFVPFNGENMNSNQVSQNNHFKSPRNPGHEEHKRSKAKYSKNSETSVYVSRTVIEEDSLNVSAHALPSNDGVLEMDMDASAVDLAKDQHGSRHIQQRIEGASESEITSMISELTQDEDQLVLLVGDVFGNYVIQKLFDHGNEQHCLTIVNKIKGNILHLSIQMYGCRVVQKAIECGSHIIQEIIIEELGGHVLDCIKDQNGNHVIQKCIEKVDSHMLDFIIKEIKDKVVELSTHPYGCRVIQRILEHFKNEQKQSITDELFDKIPSLLLDQYGNYVVQHILDHCSNSLHRSFIFNYVRYNLFELSSHKFASNVVEKCLVFGSHSERKSLVLEIIENSVGNEDDIVFKMMKDAYANYVIQKMIDVIINDHDHEVFNNLVAKIRPHYPNLRKISYGKHIINKIDKIYAKLAHRNALTIPNSYCQGSDHSSTPIIKNSPYYIESIPPNRNKDFLGDHKNAQNPRQVIYESLTEFPSLIEETKLNISSD